MGEIINA